MTALPDTNDPQIALEHVVRRAAQEVLGADEPDLDPQVHRSDRADFQADLAMRLARRLKKPPRAVAESLVAAISAPELVERVEIAGPGFINFTLRPEWLSRAARAMRADERLAVPRAEAPERVVIDYSHPNVAKEMHVGHLRSTIIGDALARLLEWRGHTVLRQNHLGDWGTPFGMLIEHLLDLGEDRARRDLEVGELAAFYKAARGKFDADEAFRERSRKRVVALQGGDEETLAWWRLLVELSERYFETVYAKLDVTLTRADSRGESFYNDRLPKLAEELEASGAAKVSDGALCLFPAGFANKEGQPLPLIVRKSDGGYGYGTTDLAAIRYRVDELGATRLLYVVGAPQAQHLGMVFTAARELGWLKAPARAEHVAFGSVLGTDKKMFRSRAGDTVRLIDLIDEAIARAEAVVAVKASDELSPEERAAVARMVGTGSLKYADLSSDRVKDYVFDVERMVSFDGNSAGYVQYAYARTRSVLRKAAGEVPGDIEVVEPRERELVLTLLGFAGAVRAVEETLEPHRLVGYLYALASSFTAFYDACPILKSAPEVRASRLALTDLAGRTLARGLALLGIEAPERM